MSPEQKNSLDDQLLSVSLELQGRYLAERENFGRDEFNRSTDQKASEWARRLAKDLSDARANKFIEVFEQFKTFPDDAEYSAFVAETRPWVADKALAFFDEACGSFGANPAPLGVADNMRRSLLFELQSIFANGLAPINSFLLKGKAQPPDKAQPSVNRHRNWGTIWAAVSVFVTIALAILAIVSPEVRQFACDKMSLLCRQTP